MVPDVHLVHTAEAVPAAAVVSQEPIGQTLQETALVTVVADTAAVVLPIHAVHTAEDVPVAAVATQ